MNVGLQTAEITSCTNPALGVKSGMVRVWVAGETV